MAVRGWQLTEGFEDWDLWMALAERGDSGIHIPRVTFHYRRDRSGLLMAVSRDMGKYYGDLRSRHGELFRRRRESREESAAPVLLKVLVPFIEAVPGLSRSTRIIVCELLTRLLWGGGLLATLPMVKQGVALRFGRRQRRNDV